MRIQWTKSYPVGHPWPLNIVKKVQQPVVYSVLLVFHVNQLALAHVTALINCPFVTVQVERRNWESTLLFRVVVDIF